MTDTTRYWLEKDSQIIGLDGGAGSNKTLRVFFVRSATALSSASDEPFDGITRFDRFHQAIVAGAVAKILRRSGQPQRASVYQKEFDDAMHEAKVYSADSMDGVESIIGVSF